MEVYENNNKKEPLSLGGWLITLIILAIPILDIIMLCVWAFGGNRDEREKFAKAALILIIVGAILSVSLIGCVGCAAITGAAAGGLI
jgi:hypothetical protein